MPLIRRATTKSLTVLDTSLFHHPVKQLCMNFVVVISKMSTDVFFAKFKKKACNLQYAIKQQVHIELHERHGYESWIPGNCKGSLAQLHDSEA